jgi:PAS domain-containing protein
MTSSHILDDETLACATAVLMRKDYGLGALLESLEAPTYVTDADGVVVYANQACVGFAGRVPELGRDRWCVTWRLYTEHGEFLPHHRCPMAVAIQRRTPIRGVTAIAERPDGTRVAFKPMPTPIFGRAGELIGAVNVLLPPDEAAEASGDAQAEHRQDAQAQGG